MIAAIAMLERNPKFAAIRLKPAAKPLRQQYADLKPQVEPGALSIKSRAFHSAFADGCLMGAMDLDTINSLITAFWPVRAARMIRSNSHGRNYRWDGRDREDGGRGDHRRITLCWLALHSAGLRHDAAESRRGDRFADALRTVSQGPPG
jgi:hypothetical protein